MTALPPPPIPFNLAGEQSQRVGIIGTPAHDGRLRSALQRERDLEAFGIGSSKGGDDTAQGKTGGDVHGVAL